MFSAHLHSCECVKSILLKQTEPKKRSKKGRGGRKEKKNALLWSDACGWLWSCYIRPKLAPSLGRQEQTSSFREVQSGW